MSEDAPRRNIKRLSLNQLLLNIASLKHTEISEEEVEYFKQHPDQIDEVSSPLTLHRLFLWIGLVFGVILVGLAKILSFSQLLQFASAGVEEFIVDIIFEIGVALIGAAIVTFMIGISLNQQQADAKRWRREIRKRIAQRR